MKKRLLILFCLPLIGFGQQTYVPDNNFEQELINLGYDNVLDDYVTTANINTVTSLHVDNDSIADLTGIEGFVALIDLNCQSNQLTSLDVSTNTALQHLHCDYNQLPNLNVSNNTALTYLDCGGNLLTNLNVSNNTSLTYLYSHSNQLTSLDVSNNTALTYLYCTGNLLTNLDVSNNTALTFLYCTGNLLTNLDVRNGNNLNVTIFNCTNNSQLYCIDVDDANWSTANWISPTNIDSQHYFSADCNPVGCTDSLACNYNPLATIDDGSCGYNNASFDTLSVTVSIVWNGMPLNISGDYSVTLTNLVGCDSIVNLNLTISPTGIVNISDNNKVLIKITDMLGKETPYRRNTPLFYIYDDGTVEKQIIIE